MQAVVVLPSIGESESPDAWSARLFRKVSGVPLLVRVLATAIRSGVDSVVVVRTAAMPDLWIRKRLHSPLLAGLSLRVIGVEPPFDPTGTASWSLLASALEPRFLWLPWSYVTPRRSLASLMEAGRDPLGVAAGGLDAPAIVITSTLLTTYRGRLDAYLRDAALPGTGVPEPMGVAVSSHATRREAERVLVRGSGKPTDGFYSNVNRRLCRPAVRWLANTPITANAVTLVGLAVTILSAYWYAQGYWSAYVIGALLYFLSVLLDEVDGMIARTKFQDSPFGCWLESTTDYLSYLFLWGGMSVGLSRQFRTPVWMELGGLTLVACVLTFAVLLRLRRIATSPDHPEQMHNRFEGSLDADSASPISRGIRKVAFFAKKGVLAHYVVLFTVVGLLPVFAGLAALGCTLAFFIVVYVSLKFFRARTAVPALGR